MARGKYGQPVGARAVEARHPALDVEKVDRGGQLDFGGRHNHELLVAGHDRGHKAEEGSFDHGDSFVCRFLAHLGKSQSRSTLLQHHVRRRSHREGACGVAAGHVCARWPAEGRNRLVQLVELALWKVQPSGKRRGTHDGIRVQVYLDDVIRDHTLALGKVEDLLVDAHEERYRRLQDVDQSHREDGDVHVLPAEREQQRRERLGRHREDMRLRALQHHLLLREQ